MLRDHPGACAVSVVVAALLSLFTSAASAEALGGTASATDIQIILDDPQLDSFFPSAQSPGLPAYYPSKRGFPQTVQDSIKTFVGASLQRDGLDVDLAVTMDGGKAILTLSGGDAATMARAAFYQSMLPSFMSSATAGLGLAGTKSCQEASGCWDPSPGVSPWAFYLPLGLPMVNQKAVMLLNYPPSDALCSADYLSNFTMFRWNGVLTRVGIADPLLYQTIVDVHPIAAPGSHQSGCIANTTGYFYAAGKPNYDQSLLDLLVNPPGRGPGNTIPVQVAGSDSLAVWSQIVGRKVAPGEVGTYSRPGMADIPWVATNHPDVTSYQRCPGDPKPAKKEAVNASGNSCSSQVSAVASYTDDRLVADEVMDLQAACVLKGLAEDPSAVPADVLAACAKVWCTEDNGICKRQAVCVQARMDYDFASDGHCKCEEAAIAFCAANSDNACPSTTTLTSCAAYNKQFCSNTPSGYSTCKSLTASAP